MKTLVCHGDSLTQGSLLEPGYTWPSLVGNQLPLTVINCGVGGDTSGGLLSRFCRDVLDRRPDFVLIMAGTNDLWWEVGLPVVLANIFAMACQAQNCGTVPIVGTPLPLCLEKAQPSGIMAPLGGFENCDRQLACLADRLRSAARQSEIGVIDFHQGFLSADGTVQPGLFMADGLHPDKAGQRLMAAHTVDFFRQVFRFPGFDNAPGPAAA
jgi:lysophospholipase L1-like esterase